MVMVMAVAVMINTTVVVITPTAIVVIFVVIVISTIVVVVIMIQVVPAFFIIILFPAVLCSSEVVSCVMRETRPHQPWGHAQPHGHRRGDHLSVTLTRRGVRRTVDQIDGKHGDDQ
jgi:hypothetical protein